MASQGETELATCSITREAANSAITAITTNSAITAITTNSAITAITMNSGISLPEGDSDSDKASYFDLIDSSTEDDDSAM